MPKCTILIGVPGSGKTTWMQNQEWIDSMYIASTDDVIELVVDQFCITYNEGFKDLIKFAEKVMWRELELAAVDGDPIYIDRTNMTAKSRKRFIDMLKPYGYEFEAVVFSTPDASEWKQRLDSRPFKTIPQDAIDRMVTSYEQPTEAEGFSAITFM